jgi:hypothetical protein
MSLRNIFDNDVNLLVHGEARSDSGYHVINGTRRPANTREIVRKGTIGRAQGKGSAFSVSASGAMAGRLQGELVTE